MKKIINSVVLAVIAVLLVATPVLAAVVYEAVIGVTEDGTSAYTMLPVIVPADIDTLSTDGFIDSDGLDVRMLQSTTEIPYMLVDDQIIFADSVALGASNNYTFQTGQTPNTEFYVIPGYDGYITTADAAGIELGDDFEIEIEGYLDVSTGSGYYVEKEGAFYIENSADGEIEAGIATVNAITEVEITPGTAGSFQTVDVTAYVSDDAIAVILRIVNTTDYRTYVMPYGGTDGEWDFSVKDMRHSSVVVGIDSEDRFECYIENLTACNVYLEGEITANYVQLASPVACNLTTVGSWAEYDATSATSANASAVVVYLENSATGYWASLSHPSYKQGYSFDIEANFGFYFIVGLNSSNQFSYYIENTDIDAHIIGYFEDGDFNKKGAAGQAQEITSANTWEDFDLSGFVPSGATYALVTCVPDVNANHDFGVRANGSTDESFLEYGTFKTLIIVNLPADDSRIIEIRSTDADDDFYCHGWFGVDTMDNQYLTWDTITATGLTSGEQKIEVIADATDFYIEVDDVEKDTMVLGGASVPDNNYDLVWMADNTIPYAEYITLDISSVETLRYEPVDIIAGTALPDETNSYDGVFTFGANPSGITVSVGSLTAEGATTTDTDTSGIDNPDAGGVFNPGDFTPTTPDSRIPETPIDPLIEFVDSVTGWGMELSWGMFIMACMVVGFALPFRVFQSITWGGVGASVALGLFVGMEALDTFFLILVPILIIGSVAIDQRTSW